MSKLDVSALEKAVSRLREGLSDAEKISDMRTVKDGVVKQFEFTVDLAWKLLQRYLKQIAQIDEAEIRTKKDIFRESAKRKIIMDAEKWINYYEARNMALESYDLDRALIICELAKELPLDIDYLIRALKSARKIEFAYRI